LPEADRRLYYAQLCHATRAFTLWREGRLPFREQIADFLTIPPEPVPVAQLDALRADLRRELTDLGYGGDLTAQCAAWEERHRVPREAVIQALTEYLDRAWSAWRRSSTSPPRSRTGCARCRRAASLTTRAAIICGARSTSFSG